MHPNGAPSTDSAGWSDADHQANNRETANNTWNGPQVPLQTSMMPSEMPRDEDDYDGTGSQY